MLYWQVDACCFFLGLLLTFRAILLNNYPTAFLWLLWIWTYPLLIESLLHIQSKFKHPHLLTIVPTSKFVYHPHYNISFPGIDHKHPFDSQRYRKVYQRLLTTRTLRPGT